MELRDIGEKKRHEARFEEEACDNRNKKSGGLIMEDVYLSGRVAAP